MSSRASYQFDGVSIFESLSCNEYLCGDRCKLSALKIRHQNEADRNSAEVTSDLINRKFKIASTGEATSN